MARPEPGEYGEYFKRYIDYPQGDDARKVIADSLQPLEQFLHNLPADKSGYAYAEGKWTLRQLVQHMIDTERVFTYRAMAISRGEQQSLPGFNENLFAGNATAENRSLEDLTEEFLLVRKATLLLYRYMDDAGLSRMGTASGHAINPNAIAFIIVGHAMHHIRIIQERYLV